MTEPTIVLPDALRRTFWTIDAMNELTENMYLSNTFRVRNLRRSRLFRTDDLAPEA